MTIELPEEFKSGNSVDVDRATISRARMIEILEAQDKSSRKAFVREAYSSPQGPLHYIMREYKAT